MSAQNVFEAAHGRFRRAAEARDVSARSIQWHLSVLCAVFILPILAFMAWLLWQYTGMERLRLEQQRIETLDRVAGVLERDLASLRAMAELAARSPPLVSGEAAAADYVLRELARSLDMDIALRTTTGQPLVMTAKALGETATSDLTEEDRQALQTGRAVVSAIAVEPVAHVALITVTAPVLRAGLREPKYLLSFAVKSTRIAQAIAREEHASGVFTTILDASGRVIAAAPDDAASAVPALSPLPYQTSRPAGRYRATRADGTPVLVEYTRLSGAEWTVVAAVSEDTLQAPMRRFLLQLLGIGVALGLLSPALAFTFGRRIYHALEELTVAAASLGESRPVAKVTTGITQINQVSSALYSAGVAIAEGKEKQDLMNRELHHRVKNTLATVQAIVNLTARSAPTVDTFRVSLVSRLASLSGTHDLLLSGAWSGVSLRALLENELKAYEDPSNDRIHLTGPEVELPAEMAVAMGMIVHELATNAAKYGALAEPTGRLAVCWTVPRLCGRPTLTLDWQEARGVPVSAEAGQGFGSSLLDRLSQQLSGTIDREFAAEGLRLKLRVPLLDERRDRMLEHRQEAL